jgi:hypothetical protein
MAHGSDSARGWWRGWADGNERRGGRLSQRIRLEPAAPSPTERNAGVIPSEPTNRERTCRRGGTRFDLERGPADRQNTRSVLRCVLSDQGTPRMDDERQGSPPPGNERRPPERLTDRQGGALRARGSASDSGRRAGNLRLHGLGLRIDFLAEIRAKQLHGAEHDECEQADEDCVFGGRGTAAVRNERSKHDASWPDQQQALCQGVAHQVAAGNQTLSHLLLPLNGANWIIDPGASVIHPRSPLGKRHERQSVRDRPIARDEPRPG